MSAITTFARACARALRPIAEASTSASNVTSARLVSTSAFSPFSHGLDAFVDAHRDAKTHVGRGWLASELRMKSHEELHALWHVLLRERNMLLTEKHLARANREPMRAPQRMTAVRKSMARIKLVLTERAIEEAGGDAKKLFELKRLINAK